MKNKQKKITNRDRFIQALKDNDFKYLCTKISCSCCKFCEDIDACRDADCCTEGMELWLNQEVSDE